MSCKTLGWAALMAAVLMVGSTATRAADLTLRYDKPAQKWMTEALPIGNGRLGAMIDPLSGHPVRRRARCDYR